MPLLLFHCPQCQQSLETEPENEGRQFQCPTCNHLISVPTFSAETQHGQTWAPFPTRPNVRDPRELP